MRDAVDVQKHEDDNQSETSALCINTVVSEKHRCCTNGAYHTNGPERNGWPDVEFLDMSSGMTKFSQPMTQAYADDRNN